jgi:hypothetical protein
MNTLSGALDLFDQRCHVRCGDFSYKVTTSNGKTTTTTTYRFSYLIVHPPWDTPPLLIRPEGLFDKIKGAFGFDDIDFESIEFSQQVLREVERQTLRLRRAAPAHDGVPARTESADARHRGRPRSASATAIAAGTRRAVRAKITFLRQFCELWPRHLVKDLQA